MVERVARAIALALIPARAVGANPVIDCEPLARAAIAAMQEWQPIETAPRDGTPFVALNADLECHVAKFDDDGRMCRRSHQQRFAQTHIVRGDDKILKDEQFSFDTSWSLWTRGYDFEPTHWQPLPSPPKAREADND
jgi:hypothetical protein